MPDARPVPAYFLSLELENVRCFGPRQKLDLSDGQGRPAQWTLILGDNGVGKTTLLQCLAWNSPVRITEDGGFFVRLVTMTTKHPPLLMRSGFEKASMTLCMVIGSLSEKPSNDKIKNSTVDIYGKMALSLGSTLHESGIGGLSESDINGLSSLHLLAYGASRRMSGSAFRADEDADSTATLFESDASLLNIEELLLRMNYRALLANRNGPTQQRLDQVIAMLVELLPDVSAITFETEPGNDGSVRKGLDGSVLFTTHYGQVPLSGLSLGYQAMIAWTVDLASRMIERYPDAEDPLAEPAVVLVDEIDLHLHPRWQRKILDHLSKQFPNVQFIATAHNPLVAQAACEAGVNLALLRREGDHVVIDNDPEVVRSWRVDQILTSELFDGVEGPRGPKTEKLLEERKKLLQKPKLTAKDKARVKAIEEQLGELPTESSPEDQEAMDIIREAARLLKRG